MLSSVVLFRALSVQVVQFLAPYFVYVLRAFFIFVSYFFRSVPSSLVPLVIYCGCSFRFVCFFKCSLFHVCVVLFLASFAMALFPPEIMSYVCRVFSVSISLYLCRCFNSPIFDSVREREASRAHEASRFLTA